MDLNSIVFKGNIFYKEDIIPIDIFYASKYSIFIKFPDKHNCRDGTVFNRLIINEGGEEFCFSSCSFILDYHYDKYSGRLIFLSDLFDFDIFFKNKKIVNLKRLSGDMELLKYQKERIHPVFKDYTTNLTYDLEVYKNFFDKFDETISNEPESIKDSILNTLMQTEGMKFIQFFEDCLKDLAEVVKDFNQNEHRLHGFYFRRQMWDIILCSEFMTRTNLKPSGYAGDSEMMKMIYENSFRGKSTFAKLLYKVSLEHPASQAVRNRRIMIAKDIRKEIDNFEKQGEKRLFRILTVAAGPARELEDLFLSTKDILNIECALLDQDPHAIENAKENINNIERRLGYRMKVQYIIDSIRTIIKDKDLVEKTGQFDYIYSMGLYDYLTPLVGRAVTHKLFELLRPGGTLLIGNYHKQNPSKLFMDYWHDWVLFYRKEEDMAKLIRGKENCDVEVLFENTKSQMFLKITKHEV